MDAVTKRHSRVIFLIKSLKASGIHGQDVSVIICEEHCIAFSALR